MPLKVSIFGLLDFEGYIGGERGGGGSKAFIKPFYHSKKEFTLPLKERAVYINTTAFK